MTTAHSRRYNYKHKQARKAFLKMFRPGQPCRQIFADGSWCGQPILEGQPVALGHAPDGHSYLGLVHAKCNQRAAREVRAIRERALKAEQDPPKIKPSGRVW